MRPAAPTRRRSLRPPRRGMAAPVFVVSGRLDLVGPALPPDRGGRRDGGHRPRRRRGREHHARGDPEWSPTLPDDCSRNGDRRSTVGPERHSRRPLDPDRPASGHDHGAPAGDADGLARRAERLHGGARVGPRELGRPGTRPGAGTVGFEGGSARRSASWIRAATRASTPVTPWSSAESTTPARRPIGLSWPPTPRVSAPPTSARSPVSPFSAEATKVRTL